MALHHSRMPRSFISALLLLMLSSLLSSAEDSIPVDETTVANARVWLDGRPILPPYELALVGDSAIVLNGLTIRSMTHHAPRDSSLRSPSHVLHDRAFAAMLAARTAGDLDSVVTAIGCAIYNADTSIAGVASPAPDNRSFQLTERSSDGTVTRLVAVAPPTTSDIVANPVSQHDVFQSTYAFVERKIATPASYLFILKGATASAPPSFATRLQRDIRDAARADSITPADWYSGVPDGRRYLSVPFARAIAGHCHWVGR